MRFPKIIVFGSGPECRDLVQSLSCDSELSWAGDGVGFYKNAAVDFPVTKYNVDLAERKLITDLISDHELIVSCLSAHEEIRVLKWAFECGKDAISLGALSEDLYGELDSAGLIREWILTHKTHDGIKNSNCLTEIGFTNMN